MGLGGRQTADIQHGPHGSCSHQWKRWSPLLRMPRHHILLHRRRVQLCCSSRLTAGHNRPGWSVKEQPAPDDAHSPFSPHLSQQAPKQGIDKRQVLHGAAAGNQKGSRAGLWLRRADLGWRPPPWTIELAATGEQLQLASFVAGLNQEVKGHGEAAIQLDITASGAGFFISGKVLAQLPVICSQCLRPTVAASSAGFKFWLSPREGATEDPDEIPFPAGDAQVDISPPIVDALAVAAPAAHRCGRPDCATLDAGAVREGAGTWSTRPLEQPDKAPKASPFSALRDLYSSRSAS